jgi:polysaccharide biosynthesis/export protein
MRPTILTVASFLVLTASFVVAQTPVPTPGSTYVESNPSTNLPQQRLGPEDLVALSVYDAPEFSRTVRVAADGSIRLPMMKSTIHVGGLFPSEAEKVVGEALRTENLLIDPFVTISVAEYHSRPINVMGSVRSPIIFQAIGTVTLLDALARAGGLADSAGPTIIVTRPNGSPDAQSVQRIPAKPLLEGTDPDLNLQLTGGENIRVPEVYHIVVEGNVNRPGVYPVLEPLSMNTVTSALAQAGGVAQFAEHTAYIYRTDEQGVKHTITVPLWDILKRKKPDMILQAKDTLYVPDSPKRRVTATTIQALTGVGTTAATTAIITAHP